MCVYVCVCALFAWLTREETRERIKRVVFPFQCKGRKKKYSPTELATKFDASAYKKVHCGAALVLLQPRVNQVSFFLWG